MKDKLKEYIVDSVRLNSGIAAKTLALNAMGYFGIMAFETDDFHAAVEELIDAKEIVDLHFTDPVTAPGAKTLLFIKGTRFLRLANVEIPGGQGSESSQTELA